MCGDRRAITSCSCLTPTWLPFYIDTHTYGRLKYRMVGRRMRAWAESFVDAFACRKRCPPNAHVFFFSSSILLVWKPLELLFSRATWIIHRMLSLLVNKLLVVLSVVKWYRRRRCQKQTIKWTKWNRQLLHHLIVGHNNIWSFHWLYVLKMNDFFHIFFIHCYFFFNEILSLLPETCTVYISVNSLWMIYGNECYYCSLC